MCGRYVMAKTTADLVAEAEAEAGANLELRSSWNVAPTSNVPVVLERFVAGPQGSRRRVRQVHVARWGLVPGWAKDASAGVRAFNARSETVLEKPTFRDAVVSRRCAVPVQGYYEWKTGPGKTKRPYYVQRADGALTFFAGLYEWWRDPSKAPGEAGSWLLSTSILTTAAPDPVDIRTAGQPDVLAELGELHDRLPVPLNREDMAAWLDPAAPDAAALVRRVVTGAHGEAAHWTLSEVGSAVGNVRNDGPELLAAPAPEAAEPALF
ncbi:SOS response-associated peptidase [Arthrobacter gengyunqii]|uniref:Abasic site processing protein n=1 Tax=Arthrobacter gengyunqii TaxID=2886940 RepID=A0ABS8GF17_9MICC|nr:SOS response-associated peptidase [Arthrobacter gengyunqii]MCC3265224.1 SOS response-associated peptidase [Arthrobacter gengyunqii]